MKRSLKELIRTIPDFPKPGIQFRDITTLLEDRWGFKETVDLLVENFQHSPIDKVVAIESRGFVLGGAMAHHLQCGLVLVRKVGKLPGETIHVEYDLEYGKDILEVHRGAIQPGERCLIVDDLLATGGTARAATRLVEKLKGVVVGCSFVIALPELKGTESLQDYKCHWLVEFAGH